MTIELRIAIASIVFAYFCVRWMRGYGWRAENKHDNTNLLLVSSIKFRVVFILAGCSALLSYGALITYIVRRLT